MLLGLDIGTSALKGALFGEGGILLAEASHGYPSFMPRTGWMEQNPADWFDAACTVIPVLLEAARADARDVRAVGVAGQSWATVLLGADGTSLCPAPLWLDTRAAAQCERFVDDEALFRLSANPFMPGYMTPKLLWFAEREPDIMRRARHCLSSNGYIAYRLTGEATMDLSQAYGLHCFNMERGAYDAAACERLGVNASLLPALYPCHAVVGEVTRAAAALTGLAEGTPVVAGGLDAACGTLGVGVHAVGQAQEQGGRAGGMSIVTPFTRHPALIMSRHVAVRGDGEPLFLLQGGTVGGGGALSWFRHTLAEHVDVRALDAEAASSPPGANGLLFLPYMAGERSPIWNPSARGVFFGLRFDTARADMARAVMEGVALSLKHNLETAKAAGADPEVLHATGGASHSRVWTQIKSDVTGKALRVSNASTSTALGAAMLAGVGAGVYSTFGDAVQAAAPAVVRTHVPDRAAHNVYSAIYPRYLELYERLKPMMKGDMV